MPFVTSYDLYAKRTKLNIVVKNAVPGELSHTYWFKASDLVQYTQLTTTTVLIWWSIYWVNQFADVNNTGDRIYYHYTLDPSGNLKRSGMPSANVDSSTSFQVRNYGESLGNIFTDKNLIKSVFIPTDSYGWLFNYELDQITSTIDYGLDPKNNPNVTTFQEMTLVSYSSISSATNWKPSQPTSGSTGSTGSSGPSGTSGPTNDQPTTCMLPAALFDNRRQDSNRSRYVRPDLSSSEYTRIVNAEDYTPDTPFYYKLSDMYQDLCIYDYIYYCVDIAPVKGLTKVYVRIDPYGNTNAARSGAVLPPENYPLIDYGTNVFNIYTISKNNEWNFDNLYIPTNFYGALLTEEVDYIAKNGCSGTFKTMTYQDYVMLDTYQLLNNNQENQPPENNDPDPDLNPPPVDTTDPNDIPQVDTTDPNDPPVNTNNTPPDTEDPQKEPDIIVLNPDGTMTNLTTGSIREVIDKLKQFSKRGKGGDMKTPEVEKPKKNNSLNIIFGLLVATVIVYAIVEESGKRNIMTINI